MYGYEICSEIFQTISIAANSCPAAIDALSTLTKLSRCVEILRNKIGWNKADISPWPPHTHYSIILLVV